METWEKLMLMDIKIKVDNFRSRYWQRLDHEFHPDMQDIIFLLQLIETHIETPARAKGNHASGGYSSTTNQELQRSGSL